MKASMTAAALAVFAVLGAVAGQYDRYAPIRQAITWTGCAGDSSGVYQCGEFDAPLDYGNPSAGKATIAVIKYPSVAAPRLGSIFINPGGPGDGGVSFLVSGMGDVLSQDTGGQYDIVAWDPRGVGSTNPQVSCFNTTAEEAAFWQGTVVGGLEAKGNFTSANPNDPNVQAFWAQEPLTDTMLYEVGQKCWVSNGDTLLYVGTAAVVRDIVGMTDLLDGPGALVNYWGFSYGTVIGNYLVNMFPDRVGRVIIDGVVNTLKYASGPSYEIWAFQIQDTDHVYAGFLSACAAAGPTACAIAGTGSTPDSIKTWVQNLMDTAYDFYKAGGPISSGDIRSTIFQGMYSPTQWPTLASNLYDMANVVYNNNTALGKRGLKESNALRSPGPFRIPRNIRRSASHGLNDFAFQAITCADAMDSGNTTTVDVFNEIILASQTVSEMFGPSFGIGGFFCHKWVARAVERYSGPWNRTLRNPILVIGNRADPITPYAGAKIVADMLASGAVLVEQDDYGHTSLAEHSDCTLSIISQFFANGTYPTPNQFCGTNQVLFPVAPITKASLEVVPLDPKFDPTIPVPGSGQFLSLTDTNSTTALQDQVNSLQHTRTQLRILSGVLALLLAFVLVGLCFALCCGRRGPRGAAGAVNLLVDDHQAGYIQKGGFLKPARDSTDSLHDYSDPFDPSEVATYAEGGKGATYHRDATR